ncbi:Bug family tripartite tricarboxylate transporter substrate binding protein [Noviherbaspirillum massiliense]|uniref:Bug family tripartite tricarboxylate transporter substrate binding protein n=1 Tax=Noviherbaspirillum massiliense TaxID=1465823 RepID=UPI000687551B|nr:tripartite tricarboxylate transporter substrate binding protein [Noviherbaspirillum massiliense]
MDSSRSSQSCKSVKSLRSKSKRLFLSTLCALALVPAAGASAAEWAPTKPIRLVVPYGPGGSSDVIARLVAREMSNTLGQQVVVENKGGGSGTIAMQDVARSAPDGYTLVLGHVGVLAVNPAMFARLSYDPDRDFAPVTHLVNVPMIFVVNSEVPAKNLTEFVALAKSKPGELNYGSAGNGSAGHLAFEMLKQATGIDVVHVPYKGTGAQLTDLLSNTTSAASAGVPPFLPHMKTGRIRALAIGSAQRIPLLPDLPTVAELGYPNFESSQWFGLLAPKGTPKEVVARLHKDAVKALNSPNVKQRLQEDASISVGAGPEEFAKFIKAERVRWGEVVRKAKLKAE